MENNDRQQDDANFAEVREDMFAGPSAGEAVSEDAGQGDREGGLVNWDLPQREQGFVEGEYAPGSEYGPGIIPEDKLYEEDGEIEMPPEYVGRATRPKARSRTAPPALGVVRRPSSMVSRPAPLMPETAKSRCPQSMSGGLSRLPTVSGPDSQDATPLTARRR